MKLPLANHHVHAVFLAVACLCCAVNSVYEEPKNVTLDYLDRPAIPQLDNEGNVIGTVSGTINSGNNARRENQQHDSEEQKNLAKQTAAADVKSYRGQQLLYQKATPTIHVVPDFMGSMLTGSLATGVLQQHVQPAQKVDTSNVMTIYQRADQNNGAASRNVIRGSKRSTAVNTPSAISHSERVPHSGSTSGYQRRQSPTFQDSSGSRFFIGKPQTRVVVTDSRQPVASSSESNGGFWQTTARRYPLRVTEAISATFARRQQPQQHLGVKYQTPQPSYFSTVKYGPISRGSQQGSGKRSSSIAFQRAGTANGSIFSRDQADSVEKNRKTNGYEYRYR